MAGRPRAGESVRDRPKHSGVHFTLRLLAPYPARSGEAEVTFIGDLTVATGAGHINTESGCRSERVPKFNQFLRDL